MLEKKVFNMLFFRRKLHRTKSTKANQSCSTVSVLGLSGGTASDLENPIVCTGTSPDFQWDSLHYFADMTFLQCFPSASARETHLHGIQDTSITHNSSKSC
ncbi:hypothetical protein MUCCIDRAFT_78882 [Mucor lusitanicus CBS 277.49]|uniref:Uncharacterized protein n=1 Tax=Mucor lusitanicus CBS 277.49 TaxID=747725 RepID=A0A168NBI4_MUCCL|nr:hypothetical protein MUCCIDRAFT_78882 [Mucor lusitanicus CBS 277.49]